MVTVVIVVAVAVAAVVAVVAVVVAVAVAVAVAAVAVDLVYGRKKPIWGYVAAVEERVSGGLREGFPGVSEGFRGFPGVSGARAEWRGRAPCGNLYSFWYSTGGFLCNLRPLI